MGLAASQARFLGLTARKSNVEYQGQQINQARTALSNEVMGLYQKYNNLDVPVPPSVEDYVKTTYTLESTYEDLQIDSFSKISGGEYDGYYNVTMSYSKELAQAYIYEARDSVISAKKSADDYTYLNFQIGIDSYTYDSNNTDGSTITKITENYEQYQGLKTIMDSQGLTDGTFFMYMKNGVAYYTSQNDLDSTAFEEVDGKEMYYGTYSFDYQGKRNIDEAVNAIAALTQNSNGRLATIQVLKCEDMESLEGHTYSIKTGTEDDQQAYEDAMNQYYYKKQLYENEVEKINKETEKIQTEDKSLELKLSQLNTEQNALSTEMEAVTQVIKDTIDSVFKTFNS